MTEHIQKDAQVRFLSGPAYLMVSNEKAFSLFVFLTLLIGCMAIFLLANNLWQIVPLSKDYLARMRAEAAYWLIYKSPYGNNAAYATIRPSTAPAHSIPVLLYHGEGSGSDMPTSTFVKHLRALKAAGWRTINMKQFEAYMKNGATIPDRSFLLTFDDGRKDTFYNADPVMKDLGFTGVMFVITAFSLPQTAVNKSTFYLSPSELQYMQKTGRWELESHGDQDHRTYNVQSTTDLSLQAQTIPGHFMTNKFWNGGANRFETDSEFAERVRKDMTISKQVLEDMFGEPVLGYAYPFNDFGQQGSNFAGARSVLDRVIPSVYEFGFYQIGRGDPDTFNYPDPAVYMIARIEPTAKWSTDELLAALDTGSAKELPWQRSQFGAEWIGVWGNVEPGAQLTLSATPYTSGATAFLNGSGWWLDYRFSVDVVKRSGASVVLIARNRDDHNNIACAFNDGFVRVERRSDTSKVELSVAPANPFSSDDSTQLGMEVKGNVVTCLSRGSVIVSAATGNPAVQKGGIGLEVWDEKMGVANAAFSSILVQPE